MLTNVDPFPLPIHNPLINLKTDPQDQPGVGFLDLKSIESDE